MAASDWERFLLGVGDFPICGSFGGPVEVVDSLLILFVKWGLRWE